MLPEAYVAAPDAATTPDAPHCLARQHHELWLACGGPCPEQLEDPTHKVFEETHNAVELLQQSIQQAHLEREEREEGEGVKRCNDCVGPLVSCSGHLYWGARASLVLTSK